jgi:hypothetical protein
MDAGHWVFLTKESSQTLMITWHTSTLYRVPSSGLFFLNNLSIVMVQTGSYWNGYHLCSFVQGRTG